MPTNHGCKPITKVTKMTKKNKVNDATLTQTSGQKSSYGNYYSTIESDNLQKLETLGAKFCPIVWGDKRPQGTGWQKNPLTLSQVDLNTKGIGILLGHSNLIAIDIDNPEGRDRFEQYFGVAPCDCLSVSWSSGKNFAGEYQPEIGHTSNIQILLKLSDTQATQLEGRKVFKNNTLDLRWHGCQSVLPSRSPHPGTGKPYIWHHSPSEYEIADMPADIFERMLVDLSANSNPQPSAPTIPLTYTDAPPLTIFLAKEHRQYIDAGAPQGSRNDAGFRLASDLIGTELRLNYLGIEYTERARDLFDYFCDRCSPSLNGEREVIWKSANKNTPTACLTDEMIVSCHKSWLKRQQVKTGNHGSQDVREKLEDIYQGNSEQNSSPQPDKIDSHWADDIAKEYQEHLAWDDTIKEWRSYDQGLWLVIPDLKVGQTIKSYLRSHGKGCTNGKVSSIAGLLKMELFREKWNGDPDLIPFNDGVYSLSKNLLLPHSPSHNLTWQLPHKFFTESSDWEKIDEWLTFATKGNQRDKNILIAFAAATLKGKSDLQKFLHLLGHGGSGKGTYIRLLEDLVGADNCYSSSLVEWNNVRFESANGYGKRLIYFPDENSKISNIEGLKKLTGGDSIRFEEKGKKATNYKYKGMVLISSNDSPFIGESTSAIARRQIEIPFTAQTDDLKWRNLNKEFQPEIPAFTRHLLSLSDEWIDQVLRGSRGFGDLTCSAWENHCKNDAIAGWLDEWGIFDPAFSTPIGSTKADTDDKYADCLTLYQSYTLYCSKTNHSPKSLRRFSADLIELAMVMKQKLTKTHTRTGKVLTGLRLRNEKLDVEIPTFTEILASDETDGDGCVTDSVTDSVTDETLAVYGCDGCDGLKPNFFNDTIKTNLTTDGDGCVTDSVTDSVTDETLAVYGCDGCDGLKPNFFNDQFYEWSDPEIKEIARDLLLAAKDDDIETFQTLVSTYYLESKSANKKRVWAAMTQNDRAIIKSFTDKHKRDCLIDSW